MVEHHDGRFFHDDSSNKPCRKKINNVTNVSVLLFYFHLFIIHNEHIWDIYMSRGSLLGTPCRV